MTCKLNVDPELKISPYGARLLPAVEPRDTGHDQVRAAMAQRQEKHRSSPWAHRSSHEALPFDAPRRRAPKVYCVPEHVEDGDIRGKLRQQGFRVATGINYLCAWVHTAGKGTSCGVPLPVRQSASAIVDAIHARLAELNLMDAGVIWLDPDDCRLLLHWPDDAAEVEEYHSVYGLEALKKRGDSVDVPFTQFPEDVKPNVRMQAIHMDHVLSRAHRSIWIEVEHDNDSQVMRVTRVTDSITAKARHPPRRLPQAAGMRHFIASLSAKVSPIPGQQDHFEVAVEVLPQLSRQLGAGRLLDVVPADRVEHAARRLTGLARCLAAQATSAERIARPIDFELPY